jgi:hypothetical protein
MVRGATIRDRKYRADKNTDDPQRRTIPRFDPRRPPGLGRRLLAFARDLLNSDYADHRPTFQLFAQSPPYAHLAAVDRNFDWDTPLRLVHKSAGLSERVLTDIEPAQSRAAGS